MTRRLLQLVLLAAPIACGAGAPASETVMPSSTSSDVRKVPLSPPGDLLAALGIVNEWQKERRNNMVVLSTLGL